jgi:hypothetical protein
LAGLVITSGIGQLGIFRSGLKILVPDPILHKLEIATRVEEMRGNRVLEAMELPLLQWEARLLAVGLHGAPQRAPIDGHAAVG